MRKGIRSLILLIVVVAVALVNTRVSTAQDDERRYFNETGHWVYGEFLTSYDSVTQPDVIFGDPITEVFYSTVTGRPIQYFERGVFELHPESEDLRIVWKPLGKLLYQPGSQVLSIAPNFPACQTFDESGQEFQVCYAFLSFFVKNGGIAQFGYPISNIEVLEGRIVQWFQRARFEWHPELAEGSQVVLSKLGLEYFGILKEDPILLEPVSSGNMARVITRLSARGFFDTPVMPPAGTQTLYVIVQDQKMEAVEGATVFITLHFPSGMEPSMVMPVTDENGISSIPIQINERMQGIVDVSISVTFDTLKTTSRTSFRIWW